MSLADNTNSAVPYSINFLLEKLKEKQGAILSDPASRTILNFLLEARESAKCEKDYHLMEIITDELGGLGIELNEKVEIQLTEKRD